MDDLVKRLEHGCILEEDSGCEIDQLATDRVMAEAAKRIKKQKEYIEHYQNQTNIMLDRIAKLEKKICQLENQNGEEV